MPLTRQKQFIYPLFDRTVCLWPRSSPTMTCCQRPTPVLVARTRSPLGLARRHVTPYHYYVIDNLVDEARRQGACRDA